jgi:pimeloyl-ACP methyl ester carboxylesterase
MVVKVKVNSEMQQPALLLLPGLLCDDAVWNAQRASLADFECIVPNYGMADSIHQMARLALDSVAAPRFSLAGHSMGGRVALEIVRIAPQRVERIALLDTGMDPIAQGEAGRREIDGRMALLTTARTHGMRVMGEQWARGMAHPDRLHTPVFEHILAMIERKTPDEFAAQLEALIHRPDARAVLSALQCPTLLLCGRQDGWSPLSRHEEMHRLCPASALVVVEDSGHMTTMEQPQKVSDALRAWLTR